MGSIVVGEAFVGESATVVENVKNAIANVLNTSVLGPLVDYSDIISAATMVGGVDSMDISLFNISGEVGRRSYIKALENQTISAGTIIITSVSRRNFRIS